MTKVIKFEKLYKINFSEQINEIFFSNNWLQEKITKIFL